jgi:anthranilate synthase/indole-3-glycerol phosphate synthase/phosphoribosylanthranilate isomerase
MCELGASVHVVRNDAATLAQCIELAPRRVMISPGPGAPRDAALSLDVIRHFAGKVPVFGVCLGHQAMYEIYGGTVSHAGEIMHGRASVIEHDGRGVFAGVPPGIKAIRYHSLVGVPETLPDCLEVTSRTQNGLIMGIRHKTLQPPLEGVQFHPESILTESGMLMIKNFLSW